MIKCRRHKQIACKQKCGALTLRRQEKIYELYIYLSLNHKNNRKYTDTKAPRRPIQFSQHKTSQLCQAMFSGLWSILELPSYTSLFTPNLFISEGSKVQCIKRKRRDILRFHYINIAKYVPPHHKHSLISITIWSWARHLMLRQFVR